jgi:hypothetical protein
MRGEDQGSGLDGGHRVELAAKVADELHVALVVLLGRGDDLRGQIGVTGRGKAIVGGDLADDGAQRLAMPAAGLAGAEAALEVGAVGGDRHAVGRAGP